MIRKVGKWAEDALIYGVVCVGVVFVAILFLAVTGGLVHLCSEF